MMIKQKYIDLLTEQKKELLERKYKLSVSRQILFRKYTDWVMTDIVKHYINRDSDYYKQTQIRMSLSDGSIEVYEIKI